jgi:hypothetical protein
MEYEIQEKFKKFFDLSGIFVKKPAYNLQKEADNFINNQNYDSLALMMQNGYTPTNKQTKKLNNYLNGLVPHFTSDYHTNNLNIIEHLVGLGIKLPNYCVFSLQVKGHYYHPFFLNNTSNHLMINNQKFPNISKYVREIQKQPDYSNNFYEFFLSKFSSSFVKGQSYANEERMLKNSHDYFVNILYNQPDLLLKNTPIEEYYKFNTYIQKSDLNEQNKVTFSDIISHYYKDHVNNIIAHTKKEYAHELLNNLTVEKIKTETHTITKLPTNALKTIKNIEELYSKIKSIGTQAEDIDQLQKMFEVKIPDILKKSLTNTQGKNAEELMGDSLNNIQSLFENQFKTLNENNLSDLSATNKYTKSLKL